MSLNYGHFLLWSVFADEIRAGIPSERIIIGGFSQGGATALIAGLRSSRKLAGVVALSAWLPLRSNYSSMSGELPESVKSTPMIMCGGDADNVVNPLFQSRSAKVLQDIGMNVEFRTYPGLAHSADPVELNDVAKFVKQAFNCS